VARGRVAVRMHQPLLPQKTVARVLPRQAYVNGARSIADDGPARVAAGEDATAVAREVVEARNALKATAREGMPGPLRSWAERRNMGIWGGLTRAASW